MSHIQTVKIHDVEDGEIYTAKIQKNGKRWMGWIQEHPKVKCEADTQEVLLETLENTLSQVLEADWQAWDKQLAKDVKAGKLDAILERVGADFHTGKCEDLAVFLSQNVTDKWNCRTTSGKHWRCESRFPNPIGTCKTIGQRRF